MLQTKDTRIANNFDIIRIIFAWFVILSHSFILNGEGPTDPLAKLTNAYLIFSFIGVKGFFIISGYLIMQSLVRSYSVADYLLKRVLRIFPGLLVLLLLTILAVYFIYPLQKGSFYFFEPSVYKYFLWNSILVSPIYFINGIFEHQSSHAINGSLWTIEFEFLFYILLLALYPWRKNKVVLKITLITLIIFLISGNVLFLEKIKTITSPITLEFIFDLGTYFMMGALISCFDWEAIPFKKIIFFIALLILLIATYYKLHYSFVHISLPYLIIYLGKQSSAIAKKSHEILGDPSYGIYLYGFPVQQFLIYFFKPSTTQLIITSTLISFAIGYCSWKWVEKKALQYKNLLIPKQVS